MLLDAFDPADALASTATEQDLARPTPCSAFGVRALLDHLVMESGRIRIVLAGGHSGDPEPSAATNLTQLHAA